MQLIGLDAQPGFQYAAHYAIQVDVKTEHLNARCIDANDQMAALGSTDKLHKRRQLAQRCLLDARLHLTRELHAGIVAQLGCYNGRRYRLCGIDDLHNTRHTLCDVHRGDASEMEGLQGHLCARLANALGGNGANRCARLGHRTIVAIVNASQKLEQLLPTDALDLLAEIFMLGTVFLLQLANALRDGIQVGAAVGESY